MALQLTKQLPRNVTVSYWIIWDKNVNHKLKQSHISLVGYKDYQDRVDNFLIPLSVVQFDWNNEEFPFTYVNDETITAYDKIKTVEEWKTAVDC